MAENMFDHAVIIGAGVGGLAAAGALAGHFGRVTLLERDNLDRYPRHRPGTPQSRQLHGLLAGGLEALGQIFPGIGGDLARAGAIPLRVAGDLREELPGFDPFPRRNFGHLHYGMSRALLEQVLRQRVRALPNVEFRDTCRVLELVPSPDRRRIIAARIEDHEGLQASLIADLFVDVSGHTSLTLAALQATGRQRPEETRVGVDIGYSTLTFRMPRRLPDWKGVLTFPEAPADSRCGYLFPVEEGRWMACLTQMHGAAPPATHAEFLAAAQQLRTPTIYQALRHAAPIGSPLQFALAESCWRHFERVPDFPDGLIPLGDAYCRFNPVYGQGMSVAVREASILADLLRRPGRASRPYGLARGYFAEVTPWIAGAWAMSALPDLGYPMTRGERPADLEQALARVAALYRIAARDPDVHEQLVAVRCLARPMAALHQPAVAARLAAELEAASYPWIAMQSRPLMEMRPAG